MKALNNNGFNWRNTMQNRLKEYRKKAGLTLEDAGHRLGISTSQVSRIEGGSSDTTLTRLGEFAQLYGCHAADLIDDRLPVDAEINVDAERLRDVLVGVERMIQKDSLKLTPERKAELVLSLLSLESERLGNGVGVVDLSRYATLISALQ